ncbi:hypothetical protein TRFO_28747 [Tritrichomonas foetus]|uniref:Uncharacterized protein n=1 Tax=Tritrichomonas foetus TaxID=1144522 RepID=A0A1J4K2D8_9EUKA|nr:hypothetical protein TRFO_28747 [Tritrichomonas foetus]|eukprot:OHT03902.1 hypothetical protein TRFO_28747 [Tritrichomonas foetus]
MQSTKPSNAQILKRLRDEFEQQAIVHKQMIKSQNEFYKNSKNLENQRHNEAMVKIKQDQSDRMKALKEQEAEFIKQITDIRSNYSTEKKKIERKHQHDIQMLEESNQLEEESPATQINDLQEMVPDAVYAEALITELLKLQNKNINYIRYEEMAENSKKIRNIADALDAHVKILHSTLERIRI